MKEKGNKTANILLVIPIIIIALAILRTPLPVIISCILLLAFYLKHPHQAILIYALILVPSKVLNYYFGGGYVSMPKTLFLPLLIGWIVMLTKGKKIKKTRLDLPILVFGALTLISGLITFFITPKSTTAFSYLLQSFTNLVPITSPYAFIFYTTNTLIGLLAFFFITNHIEDIKQIKNIMFAFLISGIPLAIHAIIEAIITPSRTGVKTIFFDPNFFISYLSFPMVFSIGMLFIASRWRAKLSYLAAALLFSAVWVLSKSTAGWGGMIVALAIFFFVLSKNKIVKWRYPIIITILIIISTLFLSTQYSGELLKETPLSNIQTEVYWTVHSDDINELTSERVERFWAHGWELIKEKPLIGHGFGRTFKMHWGTLSPLHNHYIQLAADAGIFYLLAFIWIVVMIYVEGVRRLKTYPVLTVTLIAAITTTILHLVAQTLFILNEINLLFWIVLGLLVAIPSKIQNKKSKK